MDGANATVAAAWSSVLFEKWLRYRARIAAGFGVHADAALRISPPEPGWRVLDIGSGFGDLTVDLGARVGPKGSATGIDVSQPFVDRATAENRASNVRFVCADVQTAALGGPYDAAYSRMGTMFFADAAAALANVRASLSPGATLTMVVFRKREDNAFMFVPQRVIEELFPEIAAAHPATNGAGPYGMADADGTSEALMRAAFRLIAFERHDAPFVLGADVDDAIDLALGMGRASELLRHAGEEGERRKEDVVRAMREALAPLATPQGIAAASSTWIVTAKA